MFWFGTAAVVAVVLGGARLYDRKRKNHLATRTGEKQTGGYDAISFTAQSPGTRVAMPGAAARAGPEMTKGQVVDLAFLGVRGGT